MKNNLLLQVRNLDAGYGAIQVLWDINLEMSHKEIVCMIGANGAGKSTLLKNIVGIIPSFKGEIRYLDRDLTNMRTPERIKMGLGFAPEGRHLFYGLTVEDNLLMGAFQRKFDKSIKEDLEFVYTLFKSLRDYRKKFAGNLSGGEQQMCSIGRALMSCPTLLIIDELSLGLAPFVVDDLIDTITKLREERGISILLVEQDVKVALEIADRGYILEAGIITMNDSSEKLAKNKHIKSAYLGVA
ncbi:ABC transporter ATP-binding protein [Candidatus Atribacteria bacterium 1244-E10-H5-B2]|nr:MAG: ABC transporter ATP-binding protein [Candidatus Atribacteria bacterium 1244-E10-H5-B2]RXG66898.1 MAG: ABC transporter ATP-binding protein [Candidatus Atribacteria bacterium 1244-E10-H5-B2]